MKHTVTKQFIRYVSQNIIGMIGISAYVLADTFFISIAEGANGIAALNLVLPFYSLVFGIGTLLGLGSATRYKIERVAGSKNVDHYFSNAIFWAIILCGLLVPLGLFFPDKVISLLGGDPVIIETGRRYTHIFLSMAPFFALNYVCNAFVRNDDDPTLAMTATVSSNIFNIIADYILMFPIGMGMAGAALATALSPVFGICVCMIHFLGKKNKVRFLWKLPSIHLFWRSATLGFPGFVGEMASGVITLLFNFLILGLTGNVGVAAFGVIANVAIVVTAVFSGISQGAQPLLSDYYGKGDRLSVRKVLRLSIFTAFGIAILAIFVANAFAEPIVAIFNTEKNMEMASLAVRGVKLYFLGYLFAGFNIVGTGYLAATANAAWSSITSLLRGFVAITICAVILAKFFGMTGIWLAFFAAEAITAVVMVYVINHSK